MVPLPGVAGIYKALSKREVVDVASLAVDETWMGGRAGAGAVRLLAQIHMSLFF